MKQISKRGGVTAMSALSGQGRLLFRLFSQRIASAQVIYFLGQMLQHHPRRHLVVVMDQAPPHVSQKTRDYIDSQRRLHVHYLPKYSPDWNPDEKVWNHLRSCAVVAVERGQPVGQVAEAYGVNRTTLFRWLRRFNIDGQHGVQRRVGSGRSRLLAALDMEAINDIVLEPASVCGFETDLWTVGRRSVG